MTTTRRAERTRDVWAYVSRRCLAGDPPRLDEIATALGYASHSGVWLHLQKLQRLGYIEIGYKQSRAIRLRVALVEREG